MKLQRLFIVFFVGVAILLFISLKHKYGRIFYASWMGNADILHKNTINFAHLKAFEQQIRQNLAKSSPHFTRKEKDEYEECVANLPKSRVEDRKRFFASKGDDMRKRHLSYLTKHSLVLEVGGNLGHDAINILNLYGPNFITLEPIEKFAKELKEKLQDKENVMVLNFGLGKITEEIFVNIKGDGTSAYSGSHGDTPMIIVNSTEFLLQVGIEENDIDLLLINCEGCEYDVLEAIISTTLVRKIKNIQFQAHYLPSVHYLEERYCQIEVLLKRTHVPTYRYLFVWEHWRRKDLYDLMT